MLLRINSDATTNVLPVISSPFNSSGNGLDERELRALAARGTVQKYPKNAVIISEGDVSNTFFILLSGRVKVYASDEDSREVVLRTHGPGEYFGEMILDGRPRSASVMTTEPTSLVVIQKEKFRDFVREHPDFSIHLIEQLIGRVRMLTDNVKSLALMDVYGRVARLMLDMAKLEDGKLVVQEK
jgi:CRP/FNR family cyclic AMP-dependent transcriptional regulator